MGRARGPPDPPSPSVSLSSNVLGLSGQGIFHNILSNCLLFPDTSGEGGNGQWMGKEKRWKTREREKGRNVGWGGENGGPLFQVHALPEDSAGLTIRWNQFPPPPAPSVLAAALLYAARV